VRARPVEIRDVFAEHAGQMPLAEDEDVVQALTAHAPQEPLAGGIRPRRARGRAQDADAAARGDLRERGPEFAVVVADQVPRALVERRGLAQLLGDPGIRRVARRAHVDDPPRGQLNHTERVQRAEEQVGDRQEIAGPDLVGVVAEEGRPRLPARARGAMAAQVGLDGALRHADAEFAQFAADPLCPPEWVVGRHLPDQGDGLGWERRPARPGAGFPPPERAEPRAVPPQQRLRLDEEEGLPPSANPHGEQHEERPIRPRHCRARDAAAQDQHLLAQQGVLGEELCSAPQQIAPGPGRVYPDHRSRPQVGAQGVPHARDEAGQSTTARPPNHHHSIPPRSAQQSTNGKAAPLGHDSSRERRHQHRELRAREQPGWIMSQHTGYRG